MKHITPSQFAPNTDLPVTSVLGLPLVSASVSETARHLLGKGRKTVYFFNAHCANQSVANARYKAALNRATHVLPDGIGIELAARMQSKELKANLNGTDFVPDLLSLARHSGKSVFLLGGRPGTAQKAAKKLGTILPGLRIAGVRDGYVGMTYSDEVLHDINKSGADIVLVALGVPRQEIWIDTYRQDINADLVLGVGALFDFLADNVRRAPLVVRKARLEWGWRLAMEPRRMARRYLVGNATFLARSAIFALRSSERRLAARQRRTEAIKRTLDLALASLALVSLAGPMLLIAALIRLDSKGPAIFAQTRIGKDGKPFKVLKFRSMHTDAEARRAALLATSDRAGICFKSQNDPRVTRFGRVLRRFSLDELPQIINVLKGQMSIVGPRPALPEELAQYPARAFGRLDAKPGITGFWQVSGRANIGFEKMIDLDLAYVRTRSAWLDLLLIALTFRAVLSGRGAY